MKEWGIYGTLNIIVEGRLFVCLCCVCVFFYLTAKSLDVRLFSIYLKLIKPKYNS
jgi:hypothetical protein